MYWHTSAATVFQHWCLLVLADTSAAIFSRQLRCSCCKRQHRPMHQQSAQWKASCPPPVSCSLQHLPRSWASVLVHVGHSPCMGVCCNQACGRFSTSTNFNVIISACSRCNNTLLSFGGTVTPACWVHSKDVQMTHLISNQMRALPFWSWRVASITASVFWCCNGTQAKMGLLPTFWPCDDASHQTIQGCGQCLWPKWWQRNNQSVILITSLSALLQF